jgi:catechol 2,3-dioxygenase-like lactoylglutathione lyase family enzyme
VIVALDHVQVAAPANCEEEARAFYRDLLGLEEIEKPSLLAGRGGVWFRVGDQELHVGVAEAFAPATKAHPAFRVSSADMLERLALRLETEGVVVTRPDPDEIPETARCFGVDPWGNRIELVAPAHDLFT